jgi:hypothetical protein
LADPWLNRLTVYGSAADLAAFAKAATDPKILRRQLARRPNRANRLGLSFNALFTALPRAWRTGLDAQIVDPWDLTVDRPVKVTRRLAERSYRFMLDRYEPDELLRQVSRQYPRLCLVLGWVDPASDTQASRLIHAGRSRLYELSERQKIRLYAQVPEEGAAPDTDILDASIEADRAALDAVMARWVPKVAAILREVKLRPRLQARSRRSARRAS